MKRIVTSLCAVVMAVLMLGSLSRDSYAEGTAPVARNLELKTYRNVSVGGMLSAFDAEDDVARFEISTFPVKGEIELNEDGSFIYTPAENKKGRDYFGYKAVDSAGNYSQEATVIIKIEKQKTEIAYTDMKGSAGEYAAVELAERGIFVGEKIGTDYCFFPEKNVTKAEFLAMSFLASDEPVVMAVMNSKNEMPEWLTSYIHTAAILGMEIDEDWHGIIEYDDAVSMLDFCMNLNDVSYISSELDLNKDVAQACANLSACGIISDYKGRDRNLSRLEAAEMLCKALLLVENR